MKNTHLLVVIIERAEPEIKVKPVTKRIEISHPLSRLNLPTRIHNILIAKGIEYIYQLFSYNPLDILMIDGIGYKSRYIIYKTLIDRKSVV